MWMKVRYFQRSLNITHLAAVEHYTSQPGIHAAMRTQIVRYFFLSPAISLRFYNCDLYTVAIMANSILSHTLNPI
jgi:hypothetical protein